jgi:hypothetical protein
MRDGTRALFPFPENASFTKKSKTAQIRFMHHRGASSFIYETRERARARARPEYRLLVFLPACLLSSLRFLPLRR